VSNQFVERNGALFKVLVLDGPGAWLISYDFPASPFFVGDMDAYQRALPPQLPDSELSAAAQKRLELIRPLLDAGDTAVMDKQYRLQVSRDIAERHSTTPRTVLKLYYRYLATGQLLSPKARAPSVNPDYEWAIRTFYFSAKKLSLRSAYEMMLLQRYTDFEGNLAPTRPTFGSFRAYFYSRSYHKSPRKIIARDGLTHYQRNCQPAFGSASEWRTSPGSFQMDATEADIYLRSPDGEPFRPYIYLAVDSATQLIAGVWAGESCDELAVMRCLENACRDKVEWCGRHDVTIMPEQWPSSGLPFEIITDKGREFCGSRMQELCRRYGVELIAQAPFRPDRKGLVEQAFRLLQERYKPLLRGKGVIEPDAQERWAVDYRSQAVLTLEDFIQVLIHCIVYLNSGRALSSGHTPAQLWQSSAPQLLAVDAEELHLMSLPRAAAKLTRKGARVNGILYVPADMEGLFLGDICFLAFDPSNLSRVYLAEHDFRPCMAAPGQGVEELSLTAYQAAQKGRRAMRREAEGVATSASIDCLRGIQGVIERASKERVYE
jgi:hypothetical protein